MEVSLKFFYAMLPYIFSKYLNVIFLLQYTTSDIISVQFSVFLRKIHQKFSIRVASWFVEQLNVVQGNEKKILKLGSVQSPHWKQFLVIAVKTYAEADTKSFLILTNFSWFCYFLQNVLQLIIDFFKKTLWPLFMDGVELPQG